MDDEQRWLAAQRLLGGSIDPGLRRRQRRQRSTVFALALGLILLSLAVGVAVGVGTIALLGGRRHGVEPIVPTWREVVAGALALCGAGASGVGLVKFLRANGGRTRWNSPQAMLSRQQRRDLLRQVRGQMPADPAHLPLAVHTAQLLARQGPVLLLALGLVLLQAAGAVDNGEPWRVGLAAVVAVAMTAGAGLVERDVRRARRFLDQHHASTAP
jgi:hypothetical protein